MNIDVKSVSQIGLGPAASSIAALVPSGSWTTTGPTRSMPWVISLGMTLKPIVNASLGSCSSTKTRTLIAMMARLTNGRPVF